MSLAACAELVQSADPDRYAVTLTASEEVQAILWPLYAFNVEVTRAPWVTQEHMIAEIRLQWWRDALEEIREGKAVRSHMVSTPLSAVLDAEGAMVLDKLVEARAWDIYSDPFPNRESFDAYIDATYGNLMWTAARLIAPGVDETVMRNFGYGCGVAALLRAVAELKALGRNPLPEETIEALQSIARGGARAFEQAVGARKALPKVLEPLLLTGWQAAPTYKAVCADPERVFVQQGLSQSEFARRARLAKLSIFGWWR